MKSIFENSKSDHAQVFILCETYDEYHEIIDEIEEDGKNYFSFKDDFGEQLGLHQAHFFWASSREEALKDAFNNLQGNCNIIFINRLEKIDQKSGF